MVNRFLHIIACIPGIAWAAPVTAPPSTDLALVCFAKEPSLLIASTSRMEAINSYIKTYHGGSEEPDFVEFFSSEKLVNWSRDGFRTGSKQIRKKCGEVEIVVSAFFPNSNPDGADGTLVFPEAALFSNKNKLSPTTVVANICENAPRWGNCATEYATEIGLSTSYTGKEFYIKHLRIFEETKVVGRSHPSSKTNLRRGQ